MDHTPDTVQQALREGYILAPYFYEALGAYEKQEQGMMQYYAGMVQSIDLYKEDKRLVPVEFAKDAPAPPPAPPPDLKTVTPPVFDALNSAEEFLKKQDFQKAGQVIRADIRSRTTMRIRLNQPPDPI
jgi:hypothetical protein